MRATLCLTLFCLTLATPLLAAPPLTSAGHPASAPTVDGWAQISDGVLEMRDDAGRLHHITWGEAGERWRITQLEAQLGRMLVDSTKTDDPALAEAISRHEALIADARAALVDGRNLGTAADAHTTAKAAVSCDIVSGFDADATPGGNAAANAYFYASGKDCPTGTVYASAYCRATVYGTTSTSSQSDGPFTGTSVSASAGCAFDVRIEECDPSRSCYSSAYASLRIGNGTTFSSSDSNSVCMPRIGPPAC